MAQKINQKQYGKTYSTAEQLTGDVWIDGKPIYRKVVEFGALPNNASKSVAHGISNFDELVKLYGAASTGTIAIPFVYRNTAQAGHSFYIDGADIICVTSGNRTNYTAYIVLEYTKTV